jgi:hypothetical protein
VKLPGECKKACRPIAKGIPEPVAVFD